jgi:hypothetical protein
MPRGKTVTLLPEARACPTAARLGTGSTPQLLCDARDSIETHEDKVFNDRTIVPGKDRGYTNADERICIHQSHRVRRMNVVRKQRGRTYPIRIAYTE